jgi:uncharacterized protein (DUF1330 family)
MMYVVVNITKIKDRQAFQEYADRVAGMIEEHGGRYLASEPKPQIHEGGFPYARIVIVEFPSPGAAHAWYDSTEYQAIVPLRRRAFDANIIFVREFGSKGEHPGLSQTGTAR